MVDQLPWVYFGCGNALGHHAFGENGYKLYRSHLGNCDFSAFDGTLAPRGVRHPYVAAFSRLGGWGGCALSWWDNSVDKRPGSNSTIFAPVISITPQALLQGAQERFPWVFARLPRAIELGAGALC